MPIFNKSSSAIRSSPHVGLFSAISAISFRTSTGTRGRPAGWELPFPEQPKSFPMPADQRMGFHHCERIAPFEESRKLGQGETNGVGGPVRFRLSLHV